MKKIFVTGFTIFTFATTAMVASPIVSANPYVPSSNYWSWYSPEISEHVCEAIINEQYFPNLDFNGNGVLDILDAILITKRYYWNLENEHFFEVKDEIIYETVTENFGDPIYYEIDIINDEIGAWHTISLSDYSQIHVYYEFEESTGGFWLDIDPYEEKISFIN